MTPLQAFRLVAREFADKPDADVQPYLDFAATEVAESVWGGLHARGVALLAAHLMTATPDDSGETAGGVVTSESVGRVSASYAAHTQDAGLLSTTPYGAEYARLRELVKPVGFAAV